MAEGVTTESQQTYKQHPIPQHVLGVEFKLIGGLTLRQFGLLAVFGVLAFIIFSSNFPALIRLPLALALALGGGFLSLVPIQDRPADVWLKNFLVAISQPTQRAWQKTPANLDIFWQLREAHNLIKEEKILGGPSRGREEVSELLRREIKEEGSPLDLAENEFLKSIAFLQADVSLPPGMKISAQPLLEEVFGPEKTPASFENRQEVLVSPTLASEVNFAEEKVIPLSTAGRKPKFIAPLQTVRAGRRLKLTRSPEGALAVAGEKKVAAPEIPVAQPEAPAPVVARPEISPVIIPPSEISKPALPPASAPEKTQTAATPAPPDIKGPVPLTPENAAQRVLEVNQKIEAAQALREQVRVGEEKEKEKQKIEEKPPEKKPETTGAPPPPAATAESRLPTENRPEDVGRLAALAEELRRMRGERERLEDELEKQKRARLEAETFATLAQEYQRQVNVLSSQNEKNAEQSRRAQEELRRLQTAVAATATERENLLREAKENQRRIEELAREKTQSTDNLLSLQRELRELRLKQKFAAATPPTPAPSPGTPRRLAGEAKPPAKITPFIKDQANIINGYIKDQSGSLLKNAIIIIKDAQGEPVRALKSNELGQFAITTPVGNGVYSLEVSSPGLSFDIMTVEVFGTVLDPLEIIAKS